MPGAEPNLVRERSAAFQGPSHDFGFAPTPLVEDDKVIVPIGGPRTSSSLCMWMTAKAVTAGEDAGSYCPAMPVTFQGRRCVVGYLQNALILTDLRTGELLHRQTLSTGYDEHSAWPLYREPFLFLASPFKVDAQMLELQAMGQGGIAARPVWTKPLLSNDSFSSVAYQGHIYGFRFEGFAVYRPSALPKASFAVLAKR